MQQTHTKQTTIGLHYIPKEKYATLIMLELSYESCTASIYKYYPTTHPEHVDIDQQDAKDRETSYGHISWSMAVAR